MTMYNPLQTIWMANTKVEGWRIGIKMLDMEDQGVGDESLGV